MNRRGLIAGALALGFVACLPGGAAAAPFQPTRFTVQVHGQGPDVILIPGLASGRQVWTQSVRAVPGYRYHLLQVSGFSGEPVRGNRQGPVVGPLAAEIARYIADRRLGRPAIVGHSMGGTLAMVVAANNPGLAGRVMVVDMLPQPAGLFGGSAATTSPFAERMRSMLATVSGRQLVGSLLDYFSPPDRDPRRSDPDLVGRTMHDLARIDLTPRLTAIRAPMTVVYAAPDARSRGTIDRTFTAAYAPVRTARLVRIDGSGHMVMLDQPARFNAALREFLRN